MTDLFSYIIQLNTPRNSGNLPNTNNGRLLLHVIHENPRNSGQATMLRPSGFYLRPNFFFTVAGGGVCWCHAGHLRPDLQTRQRLLASWAWSDLSVEGHGPGCDMWSRTVKTQSDDASRVTYWHWYTVSTLSCGEGLSYSFMTSFSKHVWKT